MCDCLSRLSNVGLGIKGGEITGFVVITMKLKNGLEEFESFYHELTDPQVLTGTMTLLEKVRDRLEEPPESPVGNIIP